MSDVSGVSGATPGMPARLGRYPVRRRIGAGGFATVWLAYDEQLDAPVAIKVLAENWTQDHHVRTRFVEEGRFLRRVESPHVVTVYDAGELDDGRPYLVMTYADQGTLADRLQIESLTVAQALEVVRQVAAGLQALHDRDILHRDIKPANVLFRSVERRPTPLRDASSLGSSGTERQGLRAMVGDLGLGKALDMSSRLTMIAGTPSFVAPEQALGESLDTRADQYSLGVLTFLLLTGRSPYEHASLAAASEPGPLPVLTRADEPLPAAADNVVRRALARDRDDRWPSITEYADALTDALHDQAGAAGEIGPSWLPLDPELTQPGAAPSPPRPPGTVAAPETPARPRRLGVLLGSAALVLAAGGTAGWLLERSRAQEVSIEDATGQLEVTVPEDWHQAVADDGWRPPLDEEGGEYAALSVGTTPDWNQPEVFAEGVFVGLFPGEELPALMPQHPECEQADSPVSEAAEEPSTTVVHTGCPGGVTVERVVQVAGNRLLWVQVRSSDRATAAEVLDGVTTHGL